MAAEHAALIGARIRQAREEKGWVQRELAEAIPGKADSNQVSKWERGQNRVSDDTLSHIARALGKPVAWFHATEPDKSQTPDPFPVIPNGSMSSGLVDRLDAIDKKLAELLSYREQVEEELGHFDAEAARDFFRLIQELRSRQGRDQGKRELRSRRAAGRPSPAD